MFITWALTAGCTPGLIQMANDTGPPAVDTAQVDTAQPDTGADDTADTAGPDDSGDTGTPATSEYDGSWSGLIEMTGTVAAAGVSDECFGFATLIVDAAAAFPLSGGASCTFQGIVADLVADPTIQASLSGDLAGDQATGTAEAVLQGDAFQIEWHGTFEGDSLDTEFSGTFLFEGLDVAYEGTMSFEREG